MVSLLIGSFMAGTSEEDWWLNSVGSSIEVFNPKPDNIFTIIIIDANLHIFPIQSSFSTNYIINLYLLDSIMVK